MTESVGGRPPRAFLDANVLRGQLTTDILLSTAVTGLYRPQWSEAVLDEVRRNRPAGLPESQVDRRFATMRAAFPAATVSGYQQLMPEMRADPKDRHVLAAAVHGGATTLVTENVKDFDPPATGPYAVRVQRVSEFLTDRLRDNPGRVVEALQQFVDRNRREPRSFPALLDTMATRQDLRRFAQALNQTVPPAQRGTHPALEPAGRALDGIAPAHGAPRAATQTSQFRHHPEHPRGRGRD